MKTAKLATTLLPKLASARAGERLPVIVQLRSGAKGTLDLRAFSRDLPVRRVCSLLPSVALNASASEIGLISDDPRVARIWPDSVVYALLDSSAPATQAPALWKLGWTGLGVRIAVIDTGLDLEHPDFADRVSAVCDFTGEGDRDWNGHGTHVAGIALGAGKRYRGIAPEASILAAKVLRGDGSGVTSDVMAALQWSVEQGAQVINMSLGSRGPSDGRDVLCLAVDAAVARGATVCTAAGNDGPEPGTIGSPGSSRGSITVGAATKKDGVAEFSSRGPTADGRTKPDILAPGEGIVSARATGTTVGTAVGRQYVRTSGTSMATPHVSGAIALLLQASPQLRPGEIKRLLCQGAREIDHDSSAAGAGHLDALTSFELSGLPLPAQREGCLSLLSTVRSLRGYSRN